MQTATGVIFAAVLTGSCHEYNSVNTRAHHGDEIPERDVTYHLTCLLIHH